MAPVDIRCPVDFGEGNSGRGLNTAAPSRASPRVRPRQAESVGYHPPPTHNREPYDTRLSDTNTPVRVELMPPGSTHYTNHDLCE